MKRTRINGICVCNTRTITTKQPKTIMVIHPKKVITKIVLEDKEELVVFNHHI